MVMDMSGIEPDPSRMLSERDNQLHHMPMERRSVIVMMLRGSIYALGGAAVSRGNWIQSRCFG